jgi:hypothetical protein
MVGEVARHEGYRIAKDLGVGLFLKRLVCDEGGWSIE